jgi:nitroreductase
MDVTQAIVARRAYRSLAPVPITDGLIEDLARHAQLAPSCSNNQPWRFIFVDDPAKLAEMKAVFAATNAWAHAASMIIVAFSREEDDCVIKEREYHLFGLGLATGFLLLRATELGLVAHPIAGFSPKKTREILGIPEAYQVTSLILVGRKAEALNPVMTPKQVEQESIRPARFPLDAFVYRNRYTGPVPPPKAEGRAS